MTWRITSESVGYQPIATTSTTQNHAVGKIVRAADPTYGEGEFIYLKGVANTAVGDAVTWNSTTHTTTRAAVGANKSFPVAFAMSANVASQWGWYQISGLVQATKSATISLAAGVAVGIKTVGRISVTGTGKELNGAVVTAVASAATGRILVTLLINRPRQQGRIT
jgi:hypothetical protein